MNINYGNIELFDRDGHVVLDLPKTDSIDTVRNSLEQELRSYTGWRGVTLETYHQFVKDDDERHIEIQYHVTETLRKERWHLDIFRQNAASFVPLVGPDLDAETEPYLRVVRPQKPQDNIGYHRDTIYGASPYELSVIIPFVELSWEGTLSVEPGSHQKAESDIPFTRTEDPFVTKGSIKHRLGFLYAPKVIDKSYPLDNLLPVPLKIGQALVFSLAALHGSVLNRSEVTRWSSDIRIKNSFVPVTELRAKRFTTLVLSPATRAAQDYLKANSKEISSVESPLSRKRD